MEEGIFMGFVSYQEDNQDSAGESGLLVKAGKKAKLIQPVPKKGIPIVKNTVIIKSDGLGINSIEIESYALEITFMDDEADGEAQSEPQIDLIATARDENKMFQISTFYDIKEACSQLTALMSAIENQKDVFSLKPPNNEL